MNTIAFMTANYVARQVNYHMTDGWGQGDSASNAYFQPIDTFAGRFDEYMADVVAIGFSAVDIWTGVLNPTWATDAHIHAAKDSINRHQLQVTSLAGGFGATRDEFEASCKLAVALNTSVLGGNAVLLKTDRASVVDMLETYDLKLGIENHPEKTPEEVLEKIGDGGNGHIGTAVDTGWYGTQGYDAAVAIERLDGYLFHIHLKDVLAAGAHETCEFGKGVVPVEACVKMLERLGYDGPVCIEHEPDHYDPTDECVASYSMVRGWLG